MKAYLTMNIKYHTDSSGTATVNVFIPRDMACFLAHPSLTSELSCYISDC